MLLNFLIYSQLTAKMGCSIAEAGACYKKGGISTKVGISAKAGIGAKVGISAGVNIGTKVGIRASLGKDIFRPS